MTITNNGGSRLLKDFVYGMIGGVIGTIVLEKTGSFIYQFESEEKKKIGESLRTEEPPDGYGSPTRMFSRVEAIG